MLFRQFKEKNKNVLRLLLKIENLNLLFINLLLMIQLYLPLEGERGYDENSTEG